MGYSILSAGRIQSLTGAQARSLAKGCSMPCTLDLGDQPFIIARFLPGLLR